MQFRGHAKSDKFGFNAEILTPRARIEAQHADLKWFGLFAAGIMMMAVTGFAVLLPRGTPRNPVAEIERALEAGEFFRTTSPSSISAPVGCAARKSWCAGASRTAPWSCRARSFR